MIFFFNVNLRECNVNFRKLYFKIKILDNSRYICDNSCSGKRQAGYTLSVSIILCVVIMYISAIIIAGVPCNMHRTPAIVFCTIRMLSHHAELGELHVWKENSAKLHIIQSENIKVLSLFNFE